MRRLFCLLLVSAILFSLCACGSKNETPPKETIEPKEVSTVSVLNEVNISWNGKTKKYVSGDKMTVNESGQIAKVETLYTDYSFEYGNDGLLQSATLKDKDSDKSGYLTITYENGLPVLYELNPNDGFHSSKNAAVTTEKDADGRVITVYENNTFTDAEDGSTSKSVTKIEFEYDENSNITTAKYYRDNKLDHTTVITYTENGDMASYQNIGADKNNTYLSVEFVYKSVDESTVKIKEIDSFAAFYNFEAILNRIL